MAGGTANGVLPHLQISRAQQAGPRQVSCPEDLLRLLRAFLACLRFLRLEVWQPRPRDGGDGRGPRRRRRGGRGQNGGGGGGGRRRRVVSPRAVRQRIYAQVLDRWIRSASALNTLEAVRRGSRADRLALAQRGSPAGSKARALSRLLYGGGPISDTFGYNI